MSSFVITNTGLERAAQANKQGVSLTIAKFVVGSAFGYTPLASDTKIHGDYLYENTPLSFKYVGNRTIQITCSIPEEVGPFSWGEVGLYLDSGELFALASLPKPQNKYSSIESEIASSITFYCYLTLAYNKVSITIDYGENPNSIVEIIDAHAWSSVKKPSEYDQNISEIVVHELSPSKDATLLVRASDDKWSISSTYHVSFSNIVPVASTREYLDFPISGSVLASMATNTKNTYVAQFPDGTFSSFSKVTVVGNNLRFTYTDQLDNARERESQIFMYSSKAGYSESDIKSIVLNVFFPVGSTYISANNSFNPNTAWGGTWVKLQNKFLLGSGSRSLGTEGGEENVTLSQQQVPAHSHSIGSINSIGAIYTLKNTNAGYPNPEGAFYRGNAFNAAVGHGNSDDWGGKFIFELQRNVWGSTSTSGSGSSHNNMPPFKVVHIWQRTA